VATQNFPIDAIIYTVSLEADRLKSVFNTTEMTSLSCCAHDSMLNFVDCED